MNTLANKRIIVTGGTMGIGQAVAIRAAQEGADVAFCGLSDAGAEATIQAIEAAGRRAFFAPSTCATWTRRAASRARRSPSSAAWMGW
jgi:NAD(P)-dependent dehydrogenase (short-subunit alcohol dehydrogenase family)